MVALSAFHAFPFFVLVVRWIAFVPLVPSDLFLFMVAENWCISIAAKYPLPDAVCGIRPA